MLTCDFFFDCQRGSTLRTALPLLPCRDGLGDVPEVYPQHQDVTIRTSPGHGAVKLVEAARALDGDLHVIALGERERERVSLG